MTETEPRPDPEPLEKLWRLSRAERKRALEPFLERHVLVERWPTRVAADGDYQYKGYLLAVATSTLGTAADLLIIHSIEGNVWAVSAAQVALIQLVPGRTRRQS